MNNSHKSPFIAVAVILTGLLSLLSSAPVYADGYDYYVQWKKNFGGSGEDIYIAAKATFYREYPGCIAVGYSASGSFGNGDWTGIEGKGGQDAIIAKYNHSQGDVLWKKNFGGSGTDNFWGVLAVPDGYIATGFSEFSSFGNGDWIGVEGKGGRDAIIVKYDYDNGNVLWKKNFGGSDDDGYNTATTLSDGLVAVGCSNVASFGTGDWIGVTGKGGTDAIIVKYDNNGNVGWKKNFGGNGSELYWWITEVSDGVVAVGTSNAGSFGNGDWAGVAGKGGDDAIIVKYDNDGNVVWQKNFGGNSKDVFFSVTTVSDGCIAVGYSESGSFGNGDWAGVTGKGSADGIIVKYDNDGNVVWKKNFGGNGQDLYEAVITLSDGIIVVGISMESSFNNGDWTGIMGKGGNDAIMVKYDFDGNVIWRGNFGGSGGDEFIWATETTTGFVMLGRSAESSFGNGDWEGVEGKGGYDGAIVRYASFIVTFIPVTNIINVPTSTTVSVPLPLSGQVVPGNATYQIFTWSVKNAGTTGATISNGNILNTTGTGIVVVTATIENGIDVGEDFTKDFIIAVNATGFVPVTNITNVPTSATATTPLTLTGTVVPSNATNKTIVWSITDAGTTGATLSGGNILNTTAAGTVIVKATITNGIGTGINFTKEFTIAVNPAGFIPVTDLINVPTSTPAEAPLALTGTVVPDNATYQTIVWSMKNGGGTGATITDGILNSPMAGKVVVMATIENGVGIGIPFTKDFTILINPEGFIPVTDISDIPTLATVGIPLTLTGTVIPNDATCKTIIWSVKNGGGTGATISSGNILNTTAIGTAIMGATIVNGAGLGMDYVKNFIIVVNPEGFIPVTDIIDVPTLATATIPLTLTATVIPSDATYQTIVWSVKNAGTTGAVISGNILNTTAAGTAIVVATIKNGEGMGADFVQEFEITVDGVGISEITQPNTLKAYTQNRILYISGLIVGETWSVYNVLGKLIYQATATAEDANMLLPVSGMYVIRSEGKVAKVVNH